MHAVVFVRMIDLFTTDLDALSNTELFSAIGEFAREQPNEGWRHDFTQIWDDTALKTIASFANTLGGLLIVGVAKSKTDVDSRLVGAESATEYKTKIASAIATNISPTPHYKVFECHKPGDTKKRFCVVRVQSSTALHLISKKSIQPVYVRNEDQSISADAVQLRRLIERERESPGNLVAALSERGRLLRGDLQLNEGYRDPGRETWHLSARQPSQTFLKLALVPIDRETFLLDRSYEARFLSLVQGLYPRAPRTVSGGPANEAEERGADFYEYLWYHKDVDHEERWRITNRGEIAHAAQMKSPHDRNSWSLVDLTHYVILFLRLSEGWRNALGHLGDGHLSVELGVPNLEPEQRNERFQYSFDPTDASPAGKSNLFIRGSAVLTSKRQNPRANAEARLNFLSSVDKRSELVTLVMNTLLRSLGHALVWKEFEADVSRIIASSG